MNASEHIAVCATITKLAWIFYPLRQAITQMADAVEEDVTIAPEMEAAMKAIDEAGDAVGRAAAFVRARYDVSEAA